MLVISTSLGPTGDRCMDSLLRQTAPHDALFVAEANPKRTKLQNIAGAVANRTSETIIVLVDGDDRLIDDRALDKVRARHDAGVWLTYGSFVFRDGRTGFAAPVVGPPRAAPFTATHLKSFRVGLFNRIKPEDLRFEGAWIDRADDPAFMLPMLEMAGERAAFMPEVMYEYDLAASWEWTAPDSDRAREKAIVAHVRSLPPYARIEAL